MFRFHNGVEIEQEARDTVGELTLQDVKVNMSGLYNCIAYNDYGAATSDRAELIVKSEFKAKHT